MRRILLVVLLGFSFILVNAQGHPNGGGRMGDMPADGVLSGRVIDNETKTPVEYANIVLRHMRDSGITTGTIADAKGYFIIKNLKYGKYKVEVNFIGYQKVVKEEVMITPKNREVDLGDIGLEKAIQNISEVEIAADRKYIEYKIDKKVVNVSQDLMASGGSAVTILENVPSIQTDIDDNVSLRGSSNFTVLIDGRPSVFEGSEALQQIPASEIESIEIITNPSAKYDPEGVAGIINVITKKQKERGFNGLIEANANTNQTYGADVKFNMRQGKVNYFIAANYGLRGGPSKDKSLITYLGDTLNFLYSEGLRTRSHGGSKFRGGIDYEIDNSNSITIGGELGTREFGMKSNTGYHEYSSPETFDLYYAMDKDFKVKSLYYSGDAFYMHKFKGNEHKLTAEVYYSFSEGNDTDMLDTYSTDEFWNYDEVTAKQRTTEGNTRKNMRLKTDYVKPLSEKSKLEAGYQGSYYYGGATFVLENQDPDTKDWIEDDMQYNNIDFNRNIQAAYATYTNSIAGFDFMAGLRGEYTNRIITSNILNKDYIVNRFDVFPTFHMSRPLDETQQIQISYSRRIQRPREYFLDPFPNYSNPKIVRTGNPELEPEYTNSYELNYQKRFGQNFVSLEAFYRQGQNLINRIQTLGDNNIMYMTFANIDKDHAIGAEIMGNLQLFKWWQINLSGTAFNYRIEGQIQESEVNQVTNTWSCRMNNTIKLKWGTRIQLMAFYNAPTVTAQGKEGEFYMLNFGVRQDLLDRKLSVTFNVRDVLMSSKHDNSSFGEGFYSYSEHWRKAPVFSIEASYRINNYKNDKRQRENGDMEFDGGDM